MIATGILFSALAVSWLLTGVIRRYALRAGLVDYPGPRSSHESPTPRGGGLAIVASTLAGFVLATLVGPVPLEVGLCLVTGGAVVALIGWCDDYGEVSAGRRLVVHLTAAVWVVAWAGPVPVAGEALLGTAAPLLTWPITVLGLGWLVNLFNFMDGIDGLASLEAVTTGLWAAALLSWVHAPVWALLTGLLATASLGFLRWNWPPARVFMGDAGSGFLGFAFGGIALWSSHQAALSLWTWAILLGAFVTDASITLVRRFVRGEAVHLAHRTHAYQHAARRLGGHRPVTLAVAAINLLWLGPLAGLSVARPAWAPAVTAIALAPLALLCARFRAGANAAD